MAFKANNLETITLERLCLVVPIFLVQNKASLEEFPKYLHASARNFIKFLNDFINPFLTVGRETVHYHVTEIPPGILTTPAVQVSTRSFGADHSWALASSLRLHRTFSSLESAVSRQLEAEASV